MVTVEYSPDENTSSAMVSISRRRASGAIRLRTLRRFGCSLSYCVHLPLDGVSCCEKIRNHAHECPFRANTEFAIQATFIVLHSAQC